MIAKDKKIRVCVAMSGGVDSSAAAFLLKKQGYDVMGVFMKFWKPNTDICHGEKYENSCCSEDSERAARVVANKLGIPFYTFDFKNEFKAAVVDYFLKELEAGRTPNPCIVCNQKIKFNLLLKKAKELGADYLATGHYLKLKTKNEKVKIFKARDTDKDQTYFLWTLEQKQLQHLLFPLGNHTKIEVRKMVSDLKLPIVFKESFDICFVPDNDYEGFIKRYLSLKSGPIVDTSRCKVGKHRGLSLYTIGQRKGISISGGPFFVASKDIKNNALIVTKNKKDQRLLTRELIVDKTNWLSGEESVVSGVRAQVRYRGQELSVKFKKISSDKYLVTFKKPQWAVAPGQSIVFYRGKKLLGGGVIDT